MKRYLLFPLLLFAINTYCQLAFVSDTDGISLAQSLVKHGVIVSNVHMNCPQGAAGTFICDSCNLGIDSGIILTTGLGEMAKGPNNTNSQGSDNLAPGDPSLNTITSAITQDACILEFDMQMLSDSVEFQYVFGSEEYPEWVNSGYNDVFAFWISGPGISGQRNIALIPGTNTPATIDNVNANANSQYFVDNGNGYNAPYNTSDYYIQYDGFTTVLTGKVMNIIPFGIYHLKLAVADAADGIYDTGVFLKGNSLSSNGVLLQGNNTNFRHRWSNDTAIAYRGCDTVSVQFHLLEARNYPIGVHYAIGGNAVNGDDYNSISDSLVFAPGQTLFELPILPSNDTSHSAPKSVVIYLLIKGTNLPYDSFTVIITDSFSLALSPDVTTCGGTAVQLGATFANSYHWYPATGLSATNIQNPVAVTNQTTTYFCLAQSGSCAILDSVTITDSFSLALSPDATICDSSAVQLGASFADSYLWYPSTGLSATNIQNPVATISQTTTYYCQAHNGGCSIIDSVMITVSGPDNPMFSAAQTGVFDFQFTAADTTGTHIWNFGDGTSSTAVNPTHTYAVEGTYLVEHIIDNGCPGQYNETVIIVSSSVAAIFNNPISIYPNPASNQFTVNIGVVSETGTISVYNMLGEKLINATLVKERYKTFSISNLASGVYMVEVKLNGKASTFRLLKN